jgi:hypothetical protein
MRHPDREYERLGKGPSYHLSKTTYCLRTMTDYKLGKLYEAARTASALARDPAQRVGVRERAEKQMCQACFVVLMGIDDRQAAMLDWAEANGYPDFETVLTYGAIVRPSNTDCS